MEAIVFCGIQGSGKSSFYRERFFHTHVRLNLDMLKTRNREDILFHACLAAQQPFVADNTNPTRKARAHYAALARAAGFKTILYYFRASVDDAIQRNAARPDDQRVPDIAILGAAAKVEEPSRDEPFDRIFEVRIGADGKFLVETLP